MSWGDVVRCANTLDAGTATRNIVQMIQNVRATYGTLKELVKST